jgi:hypothetical protein
MARHLQLAESVRQSQKDKAMNAQNFDTINSNDLDTVTGGSIVGNAATTGGVGAIIGSFFPGAGTAIGGGVGLTLGAAASIGHEAAKHGNDITKYDWL